MNSRLFFRSFAGGEIAPEMFGRIDDVKFQSGASRMRNLISLPHGPAVARPGTSYLAATKDSGTKKSRIIPFTFSPEDTRVIEIGEGYIRVLDNGLPVDVTGAANWIGRRSAYLYAPSIGAAIYGVLSEFQTTALDISTGADTFTSATHTFADGDAVGVVASTGGYPTTAPAGQISGTVTLYVVNSTPTTFQVSLTPGGAAIDITVATAGSLEWAHANSYDDMPVVLPTTVLSPLVVDQIYYAYVITPTTIAFRKTAGVGGEIVTAPAATAFPGVAHNLRRQYYIGDLVTYAGDVYYAIVEHGAFLAFSPSYWVVQTDGLLEIPTSYAEADLFGIRFTQSNDIVTLTHPSYPASELRRYSDTIWRFAPITFAPTIAPPGNIAATGTSPGIFYTIESVTGSSGPGVSELTLTAQGAVGLLSGDVVWCEGFLYTVLGDVPLDDGFYLVTGVSGLGFNITTLNGVIPTTHGTYSSSSGVVRRVPATSSTENSYRVTALTEKGDESQPSDVAVVTDNNLSATDAYNTITWNEVVGARSYRVYKLLDGVYGFIGEVSSGQPLTFKDDDTPPDLAIILPTLDESLSGTDYPTASAYFEQRRVFARRQQVLMTRSGTEVDMSYTIPLRDDDRISFVLAALESNQIQHLVAMDDLIALTSSAEFRITSTDNSVVTPTTVMARPQSFVGASKVRPALVNNSIVYEASRGGHVRELGFQAAANGYTTSDLSLRAAHLFDGFTLLDMAHSKAPYPLIWAVSSNGALIGLTYVPDQQIAAWHQHDVGGVVESCAVVAEGNEDVLYLIVRRVVNGATVRYIERLAAFNPTTPAETVHADSSRVFSSVPAGALSGLSHVRGKSVAIVADGVVLPQQVVSASGQIVMPAAASTVVVGLPITCELQTVPMALQIDGYGQGQRKNVNQVKVRVSESGPFWVGPTSDALVPSDARSAAIRGISTLEALVTGAVPVRVPGGWADDGTVFLRHTLPLPLTVVGLTIEVSIGGQ